MTWLIPEAKRPSMNGFRWPRVTLKCSVSQVAVSADVYYAKRSELKNQLVSMIYGLRLDGKNGVSENQRARGRSTNSERSDN